MKNKTEEIASSRIINKVVIWLKQEGISVSDRKITKKVNDNFTTSYVTIIPQKEKNGYAMFPMSVMSKVISLQQEQRNFVFNFGVNKSKSQSLVFSVTEYTQNIRLRETADVGDADREKDGYKNKEKPLTKTFNKSRYIDALEDYLDTLDVVYTMDTDDTGEGAVMHFYTVDVSRNKMIKILNDAIRHANKEFPSMKPIKIVDGNNNDLVVHLMSND